MQRRIELKKQLGMALSIKNEETERLAREVANETGESLTQAIQESLKERLKTLQTKRRSRITTEKLEEILRRVDSLPNLDDRSEDEILGYDNHGIVG